MHSTNSCEAGRAWAVGLGGKVEKKVVRLGYFRGKETWSVLTEVSHRSKIYIMQSILSIAECCYVDVICIAGMKSSSQEYTGAVCHDAGDFQRLLN
jgi:hypothetical protein